MKAIRMRKGKQFPILVSYSFSTHTGTGFGSTTQFSNDRKMISKSELDFMRNTLIKENGFTKVVILNYQFMT